MAVARWLETDTYSNKDISTAVSIGVYTADADRVIVCDVSIDQAAGNGDYVVYLTRQINGSGSSYVLLPKTTCAAASGETAIAMQSGMVTVRSGDVVTCYIDGLAGDNSTPDTIVRWFELAALRPTTTDRTLDVSSGGEAGIDWANVGSPTTTVNLSGTTVKTATDVETDTANIQGRLPAALVSGRMDASIGAAASNAITAAALAADAGTEIAGAVRTELATELARIDAATSTRLATAGYTAPPSAATVASQVDVTLSAAHGSGPWGGSGAGTGTYSDTVTDGADPLDNVLVQLSTDAAGTNMAYRTYSAADGSFTMRPDPGTYYVWFELAGYSFTQGAQVVVT